MASISPEFPEADIAQKLTIVGLVRAGIHKVCSFVKFRLQVLLFIALIALSAVPVLILDGWVQRSAMEKEIASVSEKHLLIAQNLNAALSRYVIDVKAGFKVAAGYEGSRSNAGDLENMLRTLGFRHAYIVDKLDRVDISLFPSQNVADAPTFDAELITTLRDLAETADGEVAISDLLRVENQPLFLAVKQIDHERFALGALSLTEFDDQRVCPNVRKFHAGTTEEAALSSILRVQRIVGQDVLLFLARALSCWPRLKTSTIHEFGQSANANGGLIFRLEPAFTMRETKCRLDHLTVLKTKPCISLNYSHRSDLKSSRRM